MLWSDCPFEHSGIFASLTSWTLRGSPSSLLPNTGVHLPVGPGQGCNTSYTQLGIPWNCAATSWTFLDPIQDSRTTAQSSLEFLPSSDVCLVNNWASRIPLFATSSARPYSYHSVPKVLKSVLLKDSIRRVFVVFSYREQSYFRV